MHIIIHECWNVTVQMLLRVKILLSRHVTEEKRELNYSILNHYKGKRQPAKESTAVKRK
jgi:hypothetical protein